MARLTKAEKGFLADAILTLVVSAKPDKLQAVTKLANQISTKLGLDEHFFAAKAQLTGDDAIKETLERR